MKTVIVLAAVSATAAVLGLAQSHPAGSAALAHMSNRFEFTVKAPLRIVGPLFGAHGERAWGGDEWDPQFVYPQPARDVEGEVFTVSHGAGHQSTWVNTAFDLEHGHVAYAYFMPGVMVTRIDIRLSAPDPSSTHVSVLYERTALTPEMDERVRHMSEHDAGQAEQWRTDIEKALAKKQ